LVTIIFQRWAGISTFKTGLKAGAVIGLLLGLATGLWLFSTTTLYDVNLVWCAENAESLCFFEQVRFTIPVTVGAGGVSELTLPHTIALPGF